MKRYIVAVRTGTYDLEEGQYVFNVPGLAATATSVPPTKTTVPSGHDNRAWHPLTQEFAHEHGDDPSGMDDVFGTGAYDLAGGEISYPWQTFRAPGEFLIGYPN